MRKRAHVSRSRSQKARKDTKKNAQLQIFVHFFLKNLSFSPVFGIFVLKTHLISCDFLLSNPLILHTINPPKMATKKVLTKKILTKFFLANFTC